MKSSHAYSDAEIAALWRALRERRDVRHFAPGPLPEGLLGRLIEAAHLGPSVGYMQPWRFLHIRDTQLRHDIHTMVERERLATADALDERRDEFMRLKVEGIRECSEVLVATLRDGREDYVLGRRTMPEMDLASIACAIQNMWLAARAEGIGLGWVSLFDPATLAQLLNMPADAKPVAILCIGQVKAFYSKPMLELEGWEQRRTLEDVLCVDYWK
jgi:5,6-dimethylbenzimidazole synthase